MWHLRRIEGRHCREYFYTLLVLMDSLLVSKSTHSFNNVRESSYDPVLDPYHETYEDIPLDELPSPPDSPRSSERPQSPPQPEYETYLSKQKRSPEAKKLCRLMRIRKMLCSRTGSENREEIIGMCGRFSIPVHDHLNYKQVKKERN